MCPGFDDAFPAMDWVCPDEEIRCWNIRANEPYCHDPHPKICPHGDIHIPSRDSDCVKNSKGVLTPHRIMCYEKQFDNYYCNHV